MSMQNSQYKKLNKHCPSWDLEKVAPPNLKMFEMAVNPAAPQKQPTGFFWEMLHDNPVELLAYAQEDADLTEVVPLLLALQAGTRSSSSLHPEERMQLDAATAEMLSAPPMKRKVNKAFEHVQKAYRKERPIEVATSEPTNPNPSAFWWL